MTEKEQQRLLSVAMNASLGVGVVMLISKWIAYMLTHSSVIFSDAAESVVHIVAVWFAWYALRITRKPPDEDHHYGHEKIDFVSAGVEGGLICIAAIVIIVTAVTKIVHGVELERLDVGMWITAGCGASNGILGWYLIRTGKKNNSLIVRANGEHVMTDVWTSVGAVAGLLLAMWSGYMIIDPIMAILFGANIIRAGAGLMMISVNGLMDRADPLIEARARDEITKFCSEKGCTFHRLRLRFAGHVPHLDLHLQVQDAMPMQEAHSLATELEDRLRNVFGARTEVFTHLESMTQPDGHV